jgi:hypothetical protein
VWVAEVDLHACLGGQVDVALTSHGLGGG